jgi:hypothetical protein
MPTRRMVLITSTVVACAAYAAPAALADGVVTVTIPAPAHQVQRDAGGDLISIEGYGHIPEPGRPDLPSRIFAIAIPPGMEMTDLTWETGATEQLPGSYDLAPVVLHRVLGDADPDLEAARQAACDAAYAETYGVDDLYPAEPVSFVRSAQYRQYNLVDVRVTPLQYRPVSGTVTRHEDITVHVHFAKSPDADPVMDSLPGVEDIARSIVVNYEDAQKMYSGTRGGARGLHDYVIITLPALQSAVDPIVAWETSKGRNVHVVTTTYIELSYGGRDLAEKMRTFLREKYPSSEWGIEDLLLVGHYDDVPMRRCEQDLGYGKPETDFYFAELSQPDSSSWDSNGNSLWGEDSDSMDWYAEINVGRIPWSDAATVQSICEKSVAYEQNTDLTFKKNILLLGGYFWADTDNAVLMETKVDQPWMSDWTMTRMYEQNADYYSSYACDYELLRSNVQSIWSAGKFAFVNWAGHGSPTSSHIYGIGAPAFIASSDCNMLNDNYPAIIFADACSNQDTDQLNIGQSMMKRGGVGFLGATKVALGCPGWSHANSGSSQSLDYYFTTYVTSGDYTQGGAHRQALVQMYQYGLWDDIEYEVFEWGAFLGNPNLSMDVVAPITISLPAGAPEFIDPGVPTDIAVSITAGSETYVPGTGMLHYRFDGGGFNTAALTDNGGGSFTATLPAASCGDVPEFYITAQCSGGDTISDPYNAPASCREAVVGSQVLVMADNFQTNQGWTAENLGATSGDWQRGVPVNDSSWDYDPASDGDGSGMCYLTQNTMGNTDVDDGAVRLTSPVMDLSGGDVVISYEYYLNLTNTDGADMLLVEISSNGDAGPWIEVARHDNNGGLNWRHHDIPQSVLDTASVLMTDTMKIRFTANDADAQSIVEAGVDGFEISSLDCEDPVNCPWDFDGSLSVGIGDLNALLSNWGAPCPGAGCPFDFDASGGVGLGDLNAMLSNWGPCP